MQNAYAFKSYFLQCEGDNLSVAKPGFPPRAPPIWADAFYLAVNKKIWFCQISNKSYKFCFSL